MDRRMRNDIDTLGLGRSVGQLPAPGGGMGLILHGQWMSALAILHCFESESQMAHDVGLILRQQSIQPYLHFKPM